MTRSELIAKIALKNPNLTTKDVERIVHVILQSMVDALAEGKRIEFRGFGAFSVRTRTPRTAKNPKTLSLVHVEERHVIHFKTGRELHRLLNA